jgi:hypothetical protein
MNKYNSTVQKSPLSYDEVFTIMEQLDRGESVFCKICNEPLVLRLLGSGYHPGVYCPQGCTEILIEMSKKKT